MSACFCGKKIKKTSKLCLECHQLKYGVEHKTYKELKEKRANWWTARVPIAKHARIVYSDSDKVKACYNCGYDKHYQVCHIKAVADFDENTLIKEINNIDNLIALCPNCHWEYDHNLLELK